MSHQIGGMFSKFLVYMAGVMTYRNGVMCRIVAAMILVLIVGLLTGNFDRGSRVTFLDVGQGDGIGGGDRAGGISF